MSSTPMKVLWNLCTVSIFPKVEKWGRVVFEVRGKEGANHLQGHANYPGKCIEHLWKTWSTSSLSTVPLSPKKAVRRVPMRVVLLLRLSTPPGSSNYTWKCLQSPWKPWEMCTLSAVPLSPKKEVSQVVMRGVLILRVKLSPGSRTHPWQGFQTPTTALWNVPFIKCSLKSKIRRSGGFSEWSFNSKGHTTSKVMKLPLKNAPPNFWDTLVNFCVLNQMLLKV